MENNQTMAFPNKAFLSWSGLLKTFIAFHFFSKRWKLVVGEGREGYMEVDGRHSMGTSSVS